MLPLPLPQALRKLLPLLAFVLLTLPLPLFADDVATTTQVPPPAAVDDFVIKLEGVIDGMMALHVGEKLDEAKGVGARHLTIVINSPGGEIGAGIRIIRDVRESDIPTTCVVEDYAASMAAVILESSACGKRVVRAHSMVMLHSSSNDVEGQIRSIRNMVERMRAVNKMVAIIICSRTGWDVGEYLKKVEDEGRELWFVGKEAVKAGLADEVVPIRPPKGE